ncbi:hypothetical protein EON65_05285 [archaeon]|nr:MAG: hypothetical protein EON65_05285 [archaeon]
MHTHIHIHMHMHRYMGSGGAATGRQVLEFFEDIGIPVADGYGLTEVCVVHGMVYGV